MSTHLYVHPENQKLLWTTIQSVPFIANLPTQFKQEWFKNIIKMFYEQNPDIRDKSSLQQINKQTIQYMVNSAKNILEKQQQSMPPSPYIRKENPAVGIQSEFTRFESDSKKNNEWYNKAFAERQKEYEIMHAKPLAPDVDFSIKLDDSPINNMNELVEKYKKEREQDMTVYSSPNSNNSVIPNPPHPIQVSPSPIPTKKTSLVPRLQVIKEEDADVDIDETISSSIPDKTSEIEDLKKQIYELKMEMEEMKKMLNTIIANPSS